MIKKINTENNLFLSTLESSKYFIRQTNLSKILEAIFSAINIIYILSQFSLCTCHDLLVNINFFYHSFMTVSVHVVENLGLL